MSLYKRNGVWWIDIHHGGKRIRKSTGTENRIEAQELHDNFKASLWRESKLKEKPKRSWIDAVNRWLNESKHKRSLQDDIHHIKWLNPYLYKKFLHEIDSSMIDYIAQEKENTGVTPATVNRMLEILRAILRRAKNDWEWLEAIPKVRMRFVDNKKIRWLTKEEARRLLVELPPHLKEMAAFTLSTGLRQSNVVNLLALPHQSGHVNQR